MSKLNGDSYKKEKTMNYIKGIILGIASTLALILIFSLIILLAELDRALAVPFATVSVALGAFVSSFFTAFKTGDKGYITGIIVSMIYFIAITLFSLLLNGDGFTINTLFHFIIILLSGMIGGIIGVNKKNTKKFI